MTFKHKFFAECKNCGFRHFLSVQHFNTAEQEVQEKNDDCFICNEKEFETICITKSFTNNN